MGSITRKVYQKSLPRKRISAGCLLYDSQGALLLVDPTYKKYWEIPGGTVEAGESPWQACVREVKEELGLNITPARLLCVDYSGETKTRTESLNFIFDGGLLTEGDIARIVLPANELRAYRLVPPDEALDLLTRRLRRRVQRCLDVLQNGITLYLDEQESIAVPQT
jgi:8-oxo-dGTP pyrophosphatase MutT (NUDIX family)